jgi:hypothetical protein
MDFVKTISRMYEHLREIKDVVGLVTGKERTA